MNTAMENFYIRDLVSDMLTEMKNKEGIEVTVTAVQKKDALSVDKILKMAQADPQILEMLKNLQSEGEAPPSESSKKLVKFENKEEKKEGKKENKSPTIEQKLAKLSTFATEGSSDDEKTKKKRLVYNEEVKRLTKSVENEFREVKISQESDDISPPPPTPDGKNYFDTASDAESVDDDWFRNEFGFADRQILEEHLEYISDNEIPTMPKGTEWNDEKNRGNRYKYLMFKAGNEGSVVFENYFKLLKYTNKLKESFAKEQENFTEKLQEKDDKIAELTERLEKLCPTVTCYEIQTFKKLNIKKASVKAFHLQLAHVADKASSLMYFMHNANWMQNLRKEARQVADVDCGGECLKFGHNEIAIFYFITGRQTFENAVSAFTHLFRQLGKNPRLGADEAQELIKNVAF